MAVVGGGQATGSDMLEEGKEGRVLRYDVCDTVISNSFSFGGITDTLMQAMCKNLRSWTTKQELVGQRLAGYLSGGLRIVGMQAIMRKRPLS